MLVGASRRCWTVLASLLLAAMITTAAPASADKPNTDTSSPGGPSAGSSKTPPARGGPKPFRGNTAKPFENANKNSRFGPASPGPGNGPKPSVPVIPAFSTVPVASPLPASGGSAPSESSAKPPASAPPSVPLTGPQATLPAQALQSPPGVAPSASSAAVEVANVPAGEPHTAPVAWPKIDWSEVITNPGGAVIAVSVVADTAALVAVAIFFVTGVGTAGVVSVHGRRPRAWG